MARYLVRRERQQECTHYEVYETEIEVAPGEDVDAAMRAMSDSAWGSTADDYYEDDWGHTDHYEVLECTEPDPGGEPTVQGTPEEYGLTQPALGFGAEGAA